MASDLDRRQVVVGIPFCNTIRRIRRAAPNTVLITYHVDTGGFTRAIVPDAVHAGGVPAREGAAAALELRRAPRPRNIARCRYYGSRRTMASSPVLPTVLPTVTMGYYAPFGPDGRGTVEAAVSAPSRGRVRRRCRCRGR